MQMLHDRVVRCLAQELLVAMDAVTREETFPWLGYETLDVLKEAGSCLLRSDCRVYASLREPRFAVRSSAPLVHSIKCGFLMMNDRIEAIGI